MGRSDLEDMIVEKASGENIEQVTVSGALDTIEDTKPGSYIWLIASATAIGGMLFGYDTVRLPALSILSLLGLTIYMDRASYLVFSLSSGPVSMAGRSLMGRRKPLHLYARLGHYSGPLLLESPLTNMEESRQSGSRLFYSLSEL